MVTINTCRMNWFWNSGYKTPLSSTWPHLNSDVGLEEGEY